MLRSIGKQTGESVEPVLKMESSELVAVGMNIFLAFFLLLKLLASSTPSSSSIPLIGEFSVSSSSFRLHSCCVPRLLFVIKWWMLLRVRSGNILH